MSKPSTRAKIIDIADQLFYEFGYEHTSFASIAGEVGISRGNFYHHFKSKDEILNAVIDRRLTNTQQLLDDWHDEGQTAEGRIKCFINILITNRAKIKLFGCPVGSLTNELVKLEHYSLPGANKIFILFKDWLAKQFLALGHGKDAEKLALHLLARSQGIATIASAFHDEAFLYQEAETLNQWLSSYA